MIASRFGFRWARRGLTGSRAGSTPTLRRSKASLCLGLALIFLAALQTTSASARELRFSGEVAVETRLFPRSPVFPGQVGPHLSPSLAFAPEFRYDWGRGDWQLIGEGFVRMDRHDDSRTHIDVRELGLQFMNGRITAFFGLGKVFWGVTEARHLVDIVNQTDAVEDLD